MKTALVETGMSVDNVLEQRRLARLEKSKCDEELVRLHERAADAMMNCLGAESVRFRALSQVDKWEKGSLCSPKYISMWRSILNMPPVAARQAMLRRDGEGAALRQNSPFGFLKKR